jgi:integral membrane protein (TIGR01906 family)
MARAIPIIWGVIFTVFLFLLCYKLVLLFSPLTMEQQKTIDYLKGKQELPLFNTKNNPDSGAMNGAEQQIKNYTEAEILHLQDVLAVMNKANYLFYGLLLLNFFLLSCFRSRKRNILKWLKIGSLIAIISAVIVFLAIMLGFNSVFTLFHRLFFPGGNWLFPADSLLIRTFPADFFMLIGLKIFILSLLLATMVYMLARRYLNLKVT